MKDEYCVKRRVPVALTFVDDTFKPNDAEQATCDGSRCYDA